MLTLLHGLGSDRFRPALSAVFVALSVGVVACGTGSAAETIDRELFIQTYVDLRIAALDTDSQRLAAPDRASILERHGVTAEDLTRFAETHAEDLEYMRDVWNEVELRLDRVPPEG